MYFVYVLQDKTTGRFYKGLCSNLENRIQEHIKGESWFGKIHKSLVLVHVDICKTRSEARRLEKFFKSGYGREAIRELYRIQAEVLELADKHA